MKSLFEHFLGTERERERLKKTWSKRYENGKLKRYRHNGREVNINVFHYAKFVSEFENLTRKFQK